MLLRARAVRYNVKLFIKQKTSRCLTPNSRLRNRAKRFTRSLTPRLRASKVAPSLARFPFSRNEARRGKRRADGVSKSMTERSRKEEELETAFSSLLYVRFVSFVTFSLPFRVRRHFLFSLRVTHVSLSSSRRERINIRNIASFCVLFGCFRLCLVSHSSRTRLSE